MKNANEGTNIDYRRFEQYIPYQILPRTIQTAVFLIFHWMLPGLSPLGFWRCDGQYVVENLSTSERYYFPSLPTPADLYKTSVGYSDDMGRKYTLDDFVEVQSNDVVVDCGAFVGAFSVWAARNGARVVACEPSAATHEALARSTKQLLTVETRQVLLYNEDREMSLLLGEDPTDNSVINVDSGDEVGREPVQAKTVATMLNECSIDRIDVLKIDAEGAEPEVIEGALDVTVPQIAVDCGAERHGTSTFQEVSELLETNGYEVRRRDSVVFARLKE